MIYLRILFYHIINIPHRIRVFVWNRGIKLLWYKSYIRKDELDKSLDIDVDAVIGMNDEKAKES